MHDNQGSNVVTTHETFWWMEGDIRESNEKPPKAPVSAEKKTFRLCVALLCCFCVILAIVGPLAAFTVVSCTSTSSCRIVGLMGVVGARCREGDGTESEYLMHGEKCTVVCEDGFQPTVSELTCNDGVTEGGDSLQCLVPPTPPDYGGVNGGLISGAVTSGELRTACERAKNLKCQGPPGSNAILLQWKDINAADCEALMAKCRNLNPEFEYEQFVADEIGTTTPPNQFVVPEPPTGVCTLGCYNEVIKATNLPTLPPIVRPPVFGTQQPGGNLCGGPATETTPVCITVTGSCNAEDNRDYYRHKECAGGYPQWVQEDESRRFRYDNTPAYSQNGKWILEQGASPESSNYGAYVARQNTFNDLPEWGRKLWSMKCTQIVSEFTVYHTYQTLPLTLTSCVCTRENDCSGNGRAVGSKDLGPDCTCECDTGYAGKHCEIRLCKTPQIYKGKDPACAEGMWIYPKGICTPQCEAAHTASKRQLVCNDDDGFFTPNVFECVQTGAIVDFSADAVAQYVGTTRKPPPCSGVDCSFRGTPRSPNRNADGTCTCDCMANYVGYNCMTYSGTCLTPTDIENAASPACMEGSVVSTTCTGQCLPGYWASPAVLTCEAGINELRPKAFKCFGGEPIAKTWCAAMQGITIGTSSLIACILLCICLYEMPAPKRKQKAFVIGERDAVELDQDVHGEYYVVRCAARDEKSKLPDRIKFKLIDAPLQTGTSHLQNTSDDTIREEYENSLRYGDPHQSERNVQFQIGDAHPDALNTRPATANSSLRSLANGTQAESADEPDLASSEDLESQRGGELALGLPGYVPTEEPPQVQTEWIMEYIARDEEIRQKRIEDSKNAQSENLSLEQKHAIEKANAIAKAVEENAADRVRAEEAIKAAMASGDGEALRPAVELAKAVLDRLEGAPVSVTSQLSRCLKIGAARLEQYTEKEDKRKARDAWLERMKKGEAADWHMSVTEFWQHAELGNIAAVRAGLRAKLPVLNRSSDGKRFTVLHIACKRACTEAIQAAETKAAEAKAPSGENIGEELKPPSLVQGGPEAGAGTGSVQVDMFHSLVQDSPPETQTMQENPTANQTKETVDPYIEIADKRIAVIEALLNARAIPNTTDASDRTPLDFAVSEGGPGSESLPIVQRLRAVGLLTAKEAGEKARLDAEAKTAENARKQAAKLSSQRRGQNFVGR